MAPKVILAGIPIGVFQRNRTYEPQFDGWEISVEPSQSGRGRCDLNSIWERVLNNADSSAGDGVHLVCFHSKENERGRFNRDIWPRHRITWLDTQVAEEYGRPSFLEAVQACLDFELQWRDEVRPSGPSSPLLLPESCFEAEASVKDMWSRACKLQRDRDDIDAVSKTIVRFRELHKRRTGPWLDTRKLLFKHNVDHGHTVDARRRSKFTFGLATGFHFDVRHEDGRKFTISDPNRVAFAYREYTNVDAHGILRGGH